MFDFMFSLHPFVWHISTFSFYLLNCSDLVLFTKTKQKVCIKCGKTWPICMRSSGKRSENKKSLLVSSEFPPELTAGACGVSSPLITNSNEPVVHRQVPPRCNCTFLHWSGGDYSIAALWIKVAFSSWAATQICTPPHHHPSCNWSWR